VWCPTRIGSSTARLYFYTPPELLSEVCAADFYLVAQGPGGPGAAITQGPSPGSASSILMPIRGRLLNYQFHRLIPATGQSDSRYGPGRRPCSPSWSPLCLLQTATTPQRRPATDRAGGNGCPISAWTLVGRAGTGFSMPILLTSLHSPPWRWPGRLAVPQTALFLLPELANGMGPDSPVPSPIQECFCSLAWELELLAVYLLLADWGPRAQTLPLKFILTPRRRSVFHHAGGPWPWLPGWRPPSFEYTEPWRQGFRHALWLWPNAGLLILLLG